MISSPTKKPAQFSTISVVDRGRIDAASSGAPFSPAPARCAVAGSSRWSLMAGVASQGGRPAATKRDSRLRIPRHWQRRLCYSALAKGTLLFSTGKGNFAIHVGWLEILGQMELHTRYQFEFGQ